KEQMEALKNVPTPQPSPEVFHDIPEIEEVETEEVTDFAQIIPVAQSGYRDEKQHPEETPSAEQTEDIAADELFVKLQNYKKLLDNGLILQGEYDRLKAEILSKM